MAWSFTEWTPDDSPGEVADVTRPGAWEKIVAYYTRGHTNAPLNRIVAIAKQHKVQSVVIERRYIDIDWRSQHARFYGHTFQRYPTVCHRLHFFSNKVDPELSDLSGLAADYKGYAIMRPLAASPVGRTMIASPPEMKGGTTCDAEDHINLFGWPFTIRAMPFMSQDGEYLRCAHAALWMVLYYSHLAHGVNRHLPSDVHDASMGGVIVGRQVPSEGLSTYQMLAAATGLGLSPGLLDLPENREDSDGAGFLSLHGILCRYINSSLPPIVISNVHAWVVVGYDRAPTPSHPRLRLWRHDDARGPYLPVSDPWAEDADSHVPWKAAILPLLPKMFVTAERAEAAGRYWFSHYVESSDGALAKVAATGGLTFRTYATRSRRFKEELASRRVPPPLAQLYRTAHWPRYIWVVEAVNREARNTGADQPDVLGEAIFDSTTFHDSETLESGLLAFHGDKFAYRTGPDYGQSRLLTISTSEPYATGCPSHRIQ